MFKKTIKYEDFNGNEREETFYFNLTKAEVTKMELQVNGGYSNVIQRIVDSQDGSAIMEIFEKIILESYGEKSIDGREFMKSKEIVDKFKSTEAYSVLFMELCTDSAKAAEFVTGVLPSETLKEIEKPVLSPVM